MARTARLADGISLQDEALAGLIARHGTLNPFVWRELDDAVGGDPFAELVLHIVAQQISTGAR